MDDRFDFDEPENNFEYLLFLFTQRAGPSEAAGEDEGAEKADVDLCRLQTRASGHLPGLDQSTCWGSSS